MRLICLTKRWAHHTASGGYDRLADHLNAKTYSRAARGTFVGRVQRRLGIWNTGTRRRLYDYRPEDLKAERSVLLGSWLHKADIVHVLYGDEQLDFLLKARSLMRGKLVATFHLPWHEVERRFTEQRELLRRLDGAVVISRAHGEPIVQALAGRPVRYIPHGIDTQVFSPGAKPASGRLKLLTVGNHFRDFETLRAITERCAASGIPVDFQVISPPCNRVDVEGCKNLTFRSEVSEQDLIDAYRESHALLLPLTEVTATNSALEALACGTPVITNDVGGMRDYVDESCGWLFPVGEVQRIVELIRSLVTDSTPSERVGLAARQKAETMSWPSVADQMRLFYGQVINGRFCSPQSPGLEQIDTNGASSELRPISEPESAGH